MISMYLRTCGHRFVLFASFVDISMNRVAYCQCERVCVENCRWLVGGEVTFLSLHASISASFVFAHCIASFDSPARLIIPFWQTTPEKIKTKLAQSPAHPHPVIGKRSKWAKNTHSSITFGHIQMSMHAKCVWYDLFVKLNVIFSSVSGCVVYVNVSLLSFSPPPSPLSPSIRSICVCEMVGQHPRFKLMWRY